MPHAQPSDVASADRILVYGATGSGKSTMALALGERLDLPVTLVDDLAWDPDWVQVSPEVFEARFRPRLESPSWVIDTVYGIHQHLTLPAAEVVIGLDYARWRSLARLLRRTARRIIRREPCCNGNVETLARACSRDSIVVWHFRSWARKRATMRRWAAASDGPPVLLLRRPAQADALLDSLTLGSGQPPM